MYMQGLDNFKTVPKGTRGNGNMVHTGNPKKSGKTVLQEVSTTRSLINRILKC